MDKTLIEGLVAGNALAFKAIYGIYRDKVYRFALGFVKDEDTADDIVQTVFIKLWEKRNLLDNVRNVDAYIFGIAKNSIYGYMKSVVSRFDMEVTPEDSESISYITPQEELEASDLRLAISLVVDNMPPQRKSIFLMSREEGISNEDIAFRLGITKKTVENHLNLALHSLREVIGMIVAAIISVIKFLICCWV